jgi:hypothetical protein
MMKMKHDLPQLAVSATFDDRVSAEIACALLSDASIRPDEPEALDDATWAVRVAILHPDLARRAEVILRSAGARAAVMIGGRQTAA